MLSGIVPTRTARRQSFDARSIERLGRRASPAVVSVVFLGLGSAYLFRWGSVVQHHPSQWLSPPDLWTTFAPAIALIHGHLDSVFGHGAASPGILVLLAPIAALSGSLRTTLVEVGTNHHHLVAPQTLFIQGSPVLRTVAVTFGGHQYLPHPQVLALLAPYTLILSCSALFGCDALAERLQVTPGRRVVLNVVQGVLLWNVAVLWGHPEDAVSVALALYALVYALDGRWVGTGWLFGAAIAVQPLTIVLLPIFLVMMGRRGAFTFLLRALGPAVVLTIGPLVANFHATVSALTTQANYPRLNHETPWTSLAPQLGGKGSKMAVGGGPGRLVALVLAIALGWWARRWRSKPEMIVWAVALAFALRCYTESVLDAYYVWPALAVGLVLAARGSSWRLRVAVVVAVATTVVAQWHLGLWLWWSLDVAGVSALLVVTVSPEPLNVEPERQGVPRPRPVPARDRRQVSASQKKNKRKSERTGRKASRR
jgi:hypothetical protein